MEQSARSKPLRSRSMGIYVEQGRDVRCLSAAREGARTREAGISVDLYARMHALSGARSSIYSVSSGLRGTVNNPG